ncbi:MAG: type II asparaginase [Alphaproteobacteria bacterium]|jgi:L-asparaginase type II|nr:type II asparaginase [Alphaproteobacteria bacterium]
MKVSIINRIFIVLLLVVLYSSNTFAKNIVIVATGGTIAGSAQQSTDTTGYTAATLGVQALINAVPEIKKVANVTGEQVLQIGSQDMDNEAWLKLAKKIDELASSSSVDGIVITHGTDTIEETAYFLNLVVNTKKPIVLVGAMRPATALSADGPLNLLNAVIVANSKEAQGKGVLVVINDTIFGARDIAKTNTFLVNAFDAPNSGAMGYIQSSKVFLYNNSSALNTSASEFNIKNISALPRVDILYGYANAGGEYVDYAVNTLKVKGIVYAGVGDGNFYKDVFPAVQNAVKNKVAVVRSSRVGSGIVARNGEVNDDENGFVAANNLNPQKARVLLILALTKNNDPKYIQSVFNKY